MDTSHADIFARCQALVQHYSRRDAETHTVRAIRRGDYEAVAPGSFSEDFPAPIIANQIDTMARDMSATLAPLPSFNCLPSSILNDRSKAFAEKRTKIAHYYVESSNLQAQMPDAVDSYHGYGMFVGEVRPDTKCKSPKIKMLDGGFAYPTWDADFNVIEILLLSYMSDRQLAAYYPQAAAKVREESNGRGQERIKVYRFQDKSTNLVYLPDYGNLVIESTPNKMGRCTYVAVPRPMGEDWFSVPRGAYADLVWPQLAANEFRMLGLEAVDKSVRAPIVVPTDVADVPFGPDATIHTNNPQGVGRLKIDVPQGAFQATELLEQDIRQGGMSPGSRSGNINASVITGRGVDALSEGYSQQVAMSQSRIGFGLQLLVELCFEMDEKFWPEEAKEIRGQSLDNPGKDTYVPSRHIKGDYSVTVDYGFLLGLDANRALVFILQAQAAGLLSNDTAARNLPIKLNLAEEQNRIQLEQSRNALLQATMAYSQAIPQMLSNGQDPSQAVAQLGAIVQGIKAGDAIEEVVAKVFAPPPPQPAAPAADPAAAQDPMAALAAAAGGAPGGAPADPNAVESRPDLNSLIAGLTGKGQPNLAASVMRSSPAQG
ncbi:hypothetical protein UB45_07755 [Terrabacter sp. 28]|nr:hypothetical protein UB45_07755 [Terrabacter sp. 28]